MSEPSGKYDIIIADPPYRYDSGTCDPKDSIERHYPTMTISQIKAMWFMMGEISAKDCILLLWSPAPKLEEAFSILKAWRFRYRTGSVWDKLSIGLGYWFRGQHEHCLLAIRGRPHPPNRSDRRSSVIYAKRRKHSQKPVDIHKYMNLAYPEKRKIELFARERFSGWDAWGEEIDPKFSTAP